MSASDGTVQRLVTGGVFASMISAIMPRIPWHEVKNEIGDLPLSDFERGTMPSREQVWKAVRAAYRHGAFDALLPTGVAAPSFDIQTRFKLDDTPIGFADDPPLVPLIHRPAQIAGFPVDYPLGLPASVLSANSKWIEYYAKRGFDILTYKTVRSQSRDTHRWPNWVFLQDPHEIGSIPDRGFVGEAHYLPDEWHTISMANSFGMPSHAPEWWQEDIHRARQIVREGHQILIVSVVASKTQTASEMERDFIDTAIAARDAGADIIEASFACPSIEGDQAGELYENVALSSRIAARLSEALDGKRRTPLFVKIGYLREEKLREFVHANAPHIDGIVAIDAISASVRTNKGEQTFPPDVLSARTTARVSGWAIRSKAQEVARNLVRFRRREGKNFAILGLGGVINPQDCRDYLDIGVDAVESCTGAFLNPCLGMELRLDEEATKGGPSPLALRL